MDISKNVIGSTVSVVQNNELEIHDVLLCSALLLPYEEQLYLVISGGYGDQSLLKNLKQGIASFQGPLEGL